MVQCSHIQLGNKSQRGDLPPTSNQIKSITEAGQSIKWSLLRTKKRSCLLLRLKATHILDGTTLSRLLNTLYQSSDKLLLQSSPLSNLRASAAMNHMADLSPSQAPWLFISETEKERERWKTCRYDAVMSIWILLGLADPSPRTSSPTFTNSRPFQLCLALSSHDEINVFKIIKITSPLLLFSFHLRRHARGCSNKNVLIIFNLLCTSELCFKRKKKSKQGQSKCKLHLDPDLVKEHLLGGCEGSLTGPGGLHFFFFVVVNSEFLMSQVQRWAPYLRSEDTAEELLF